LPYVADGPIRGSLRTSASRGANTVTDICGPDKREAIQDCATSTRSFARPRLFGLVGARPGSVVMRQVQNVRLRLSTCPREPVQVVKPQPARFAVL
jgi:hypothetical protein